jgi:hypothetical protein
MEARPITVHTVEMLNHANCIQHIAGTVWTLVIE